MEVEKEVILAALGKTGGTKTEAARQLGITRKRCYKHVSLFTFDGAPADIATAKATVPANVGQSAAGGALLRLRATESPSAVTQYQHAPAVGDHALVVRQFGRRGRPYRLRLPAAAGRRSHACTL